MTKNGIKSARGWELAVLMLFPLLLTPKFSNADEWQTVVDTTRLTYADGDSWLSELGADIYGNIHVTWQDNRDGNDEIYYTKLDNNGNTLVDDMRLTSDNAESVFPHLQLDGSGNVHIIWRDSRNGSPEMYYIKLDNNGNVLVDTTRLTSGPTFNHNLRVDNVDIIHIAWQDRRDGNPEIYYAKLDNNGNPLISDIRVSTATGDSWWPYIGIDNSLNVHIAWYDARNGNGEIYYTKLDNNGNTLVDDTSLTFAGGAVGAPALEVDNSNNIHIVWPDNRNGYSALYYTKLDNNGNTLIDDTLVTTANGEGYLMDMDDEGNVHIAWSDNRDGNDEIYYTKIDNNGNTLVDDTRLTFDDADSWWPRISVDENDGIHITWDDNRNGNREIYYIKGDIITAVDENPILYPAEYKLMQNYPNPFNPTTTIHYVIGRMQPVSLKIYDISGKEVAILVNEEKPAGAYTVKFDVSKLSSGIYFYQLKAGDFTQTKKMILMR